MVYKFQLANGKYKALRIWHKDLSLLPDLPEVAEKVLVATVNDTHLHSLVLGEEDQAERFRRVQQQRLSAHYQDVYLACDLVPTREEALSKFMYVLTLRFGLVDGRARTLEEVGKEFNVTRERIRQIEAKALRKLRHPSRSKRIKDFLE